ncbi:MAG: FAD-dependent oxidoreductase [Acidimicrobiales bacterium]
MAVLGCRSAADVVAGVAWARQEGLELAVKSGGHSVAGNGVCDGGVVLDVSGMKAVDVDPQAGVARVEAGVTLGELDAATATHRMATPTGVVSVTGLAGLALGGGLGWLPRSLRPRLRQYCSPPRWSPPPGLVTATTTGHADLHWALRGGAATVWSPPSRSACTPSTWCRPACSASARSGRRALVATTGWRAPVPTSSVNASLYAASTASQAWRWRGCPRLPGQAGPALAEVRGAGSPMSTRPGPTRYLDLQRSSDSGFPEGRRHYWRSARSAPSMPEVTLLEQAAAIVSPFTGIGLKQLRCCRPVPAPPPPVPPLNRYDLLILSQWTDRRRRGELPGNRCFTALERFTDDGVYVSNLGDEGEQRVRQAYGANFQRLRRAEGPLRPRQRVPPQPQHPARLSR